MSAHDCDACQRAERREQMFPGENGQNKLQQVVVAARELQVALSLQNGPVSMLVRMKYRKLAEALAALEPTR